MDERGMDGSGLRRENLIGNEEGESVQHVGN
jgi:hypothetical protein